MNSTASAAARSAIGGLLVVAACTLSPAASAQDAACNTQGVWINATTGAAVAGSDLVADLVARRAVVLLGEMHTDPDHHRWQLHTLAALHGRTDKMVLGFEAFPRRLQSVLDDWVAGKLTAEAFLTASEWRRVWGYDAALYMPMFQFARLHRIPMIALNVERKLVGQVGQNGWKSVPESEREGLSDPAPATVEYQRELAQIFHIKKTQAANAAGAGQAAEQETVPELDEQTLADILKDPEFQRFVEAQLTWDRAMAQALAVAKQKTPDATVIGIAGSGHLAGGHGIPHQLKDLGVAERVTLLPETTKSACQVVGTAYADAIFTLPAAAAAPAEDRPRLGVMLADGGGRVQIRKVLPNSVAEAAGLQDGDQIVRAAGLDMRSSDDLIDVVGRQSFGTWLPLGIGRDGQEIEVVAKFPPRPRAAP